MSDWLMGKTFNVLKGQTQTSACGEDSEQDPNYGS